MTGYIVPDRCKPDEATAPYIGEQAPNASDEMYLGFKT